MKIALNEKQIIYVLQEALELSKAREYANIQRSPEVTQKINNIFELLRLKYPNSRTSKRGDRLYIPFGSQLKDEIIDALSENDFDIKDYDNGIAINRRNGQEVKLGKALTRIKREDLLTNYNTDKSRGAVSNPSGYMVFSKHQYDIAGMSTGRNWTSCMNLDTGSNKRYVSCDITEGSFVVYLVDSNDLNIKNPKGRIAIKPFINQMDKNDIIFFPESRIYGSVPSEFKDEIDGFFNELNMETKGVVYNKNEKLYNDSASQNYTNIKKIKTIQDVENIIHNVDDRTKKDMALESKIVLDYVMTSPRINHYVKESVVDSSRFDDVSQYLTSEYLLGFGSSGGLDNLLERFPQLKEIVSENSKSFQKKFPSVLLKHFPDFINKMSSRDIEKLTPLHLFDIFDYNPEFYPFFYEKYRKMIISATANSKRLYYFLQEHPKFLIKSWPIFKNSLLEASDYDQNRFIYKTLLLMPGLFNFYLYNEKPLLDKFFSEPTTTNDIAYRNNKLFYLVYKNYPKFVDDLVEDEFLKMIGLNESLIPFFVKFYKEKFITLDKHELYRFLFYHEKSIPVLVRNVPEIIRNMGDYLIGNLMNYHSEYAEELRKVL